jgi:hypothetical protein
MNGIKSLKSLLSLLTLKIAWRIERSPRSEILGSNLISDSYAIHVTGNHNKTKNEILSFRTL